MLKGSPGNNCEMRKGGTRMTNELIVYDMVAEVMKGFKMKGEHTKPGGRK